jgi:hypothetical protein
LCGPDILVDVDALDLTFGELLGIFDDRSQRVAIIWIAGQRCGNGHDWTDRFL